jgi:hypothetical protein
VTLGGNMVNIIRFGVTVLILIFLVSSVSALDLEEIQRLGEEKSIVLVATQNPEFMDAFQLYLEDLYKELERSEREAVIETALDLYSGREYLGDEKLDSLLNYIFRNEPEVSLKKKLLSSLSEMKTQESFLSLAKAMRNGPSSLKISIVPYLRGFGGTSEEIINNAEKFDYCLYRGDVYDIREPIVSEDKIFLQLRSAEDVSIYTLSEGWHESEVSEGSDGPLFFSIKKQNIDFMTGFALKSGNFFVGQGGRTFDTLEEVIPVPFIGPSICSEGAIRGMGNFELIIGSIPVIDRALSIFVSSPVGEGIPTFAANLRSDLSQLISLTFGLQDCEDCDVKLPPYDSLLISAQESENNIVAQTDVRIRKRVSQNNG